MTERSGGKKPTTSKTTGHSARSARTREAVVDALLELLDQGNLRPTARQVADKAGVSLRSVYVHFDDVGALFQAAAVRHWAGMDEVRGELVVSGTFAERLDAFVDRRARVYEVRANVRRAAVLHEPFSTAIRDILAVGRQMGRAELAEVFAPELEPDTARAAFRMAVLQMITSPTSWDDLRLRQHLSVEEAAGVLRQLIREVLTDKS